MSGDPSGTREYFEYMAQKFIECASDGGEITVTSSWRALVNSLADRFEMFYNRGCNAPRDTEGAK